MITLRPYQLSAIAAYKDALAQGITRGVIVLPTGCGKTLTTLALAKDLGKRTLWLAHREELIDQPFKALKHVWPDVRAGIVKAERNEFTRDFVFASVQTATRDIRLAQLVDQDFGFVVCDEAHHYTADSFRKILEAIGCMRTVRPIPMVGLTATPERTDNVALNRIFQDVVYQYHLDQAIKDGYLVRPRQMVRRISDADFNAVKTRMGDFASDQLELEMLKESVVHGVCDAIMEHVPNRRSIVFTVGVKQAEAIAARLNSLGFAATTVDGAMPTERRRANIKAFCNGEYKALANCAVLTEGFDDPGVDCVVVARPTKSKSLYTQIVGRGLRLAPMKSDCIILDIVGATRCHDMVQAPVIFGQEVADEIYEEQEKEREESSEEYQEEQRKAYWLKRYRAQVGGLPAGARSTFQWVKSDSGILALAVGAHGTVRLLPSGDSWRIDVVGNKAAGKDKISLSSEPVTLELGQGIAEDYVRRCGAISIASGTARWRNHPPTDAQLSALRKWKVSFDEHHITRGQAADLLTGAMSASKRYDAASDKQVNYLRRLGVDVAEGITKAEAGRLISEALGNVGRQ